jgi:mono/diheme cytochrome c family protein
MFNVRDGQRRPAATGDGQKRGPAALNFLRTSGPDTYVCAGCHTISRTGGAGDVLANVFLGAWFVDPVIYSIAAKFSNERNAPSLFGMGPVEMLAVEMSADLQAQAKEVGDGIHTLTTNGVNFEVTIAAGKVVASKGVVTEN